MAHVEPSAHRRPLARPRCHAAAAVHGGPRAVGTSTMSDKEVQNSHMNMAPLVGNLAITVREVGHDWEPQAETGATP
eukprot:scaffold4584_cov63-Phaeocystis_antarctica.AAC.2